jgi:hypothetical protein
LVGADAWLEVPVDGSTVTGGGDVGVITRVSDRFLVQGAAGLASRTGALEPRLIVGFVARF